MKSPLDKVKLNYEKTPHKQNGKVRVWQLKKPKPISYLGKLVNRYVHYLVEVITK